MGEDSRNTSEQGHPEEMDDMEAFLDDGDVVIDDLQDGEGVPESDDDDGLDVDGAGSTGQQDGNTNMAMDDDSLHQFEGHTDAVLAVAWSPTDPGLVATGGQDDRAFLWKVGQDAYESTAGTLHTHELEGHTDSVASVAFNHNGSLLATGGMDGLVKVWNTADGSLVKNLEASGGAIEWIKWHPKGDVVLAGTEDFSLWMWLAQSGACMQVFAGHQGPVTSGAFTNDGKLIVSTGGEDDCSLRVWNPKTGECTVTLQGGNPFHEAPITCCSIHQDNAAVLTGADDGTVMMSNILNNGRVLGSLVGHEDSVEAVGFSPHVALAASGSIDAKMLIWDCATLSLRGNCVHPSGITRMAWHPLEPLVFTTCVDGIVRCVDIRTSAIVKTYLGHTEAVQDIALSPAGDMFISGSDDKTARVFARQ